MVRKDRAISMKTPLALGRRVIRSGTQLWLHPSTGDAVSQTSRSPALQAAWERLIGGGGGGGRVLLLTWSGLE